MYYQINPTETFRERHLALLEEAENRRLSRQLRKGCGPKAQSGTPAILGFLAALALVASLLLTQAARPAHANGEIIFTVNSTADLADVNRRRPPL